MLRADADLGVSRGVGAEEPFTILPDVTAWEASGVPACPVRTGPGMLLGARVTSRLVLDRCQQAAAPSERRAREPLLVACSPLWELLPVGPTPWSHFLRAVWLPPHPGAPRPEGVEP